MPDDGLILWLKHVGAVINIIYCATNGSDSSCMLHVVIYTLKTYWTYSIQYCSVAYPGILCGGIQQIQLRTEDRENGDMGAVAP